MRGVKPGGRRAGRLETTGVIESVPNVHLSCAQRLASHGFRPDAGLSSTQVYLARHRLTALIKMAIMNLQRIYDRALFPGGGMVFGGGSAAAFCSATARQILGSPDGGRALAMKPFQHCPDVKPRGDTPLSGACGHRSAIPLPFTAAQSAIPPRRFSVPVPRAVAGAGFRCTRRGVNRTGIDAGPPGRRQKTASDR